MEEILPGENGVTEMKGRFTGMKKILSVAIGLMMLLGLMIPVFASAESNPQTVWANRLDRRSINVHESANVDSRILYRVNCGTRMEVVPSQQVKGWLCVRKDGKDAGWVKSKFLMDRKPGKYDYTEKEDNFQTVKAYNVTAVALNGKTSKSVCLRTAPNKISESIRRLTAGDTLQVVAEGKTWSKVVDTATGKSGYVANDYITKM